MKLTRRATLFDRCAINACAWSSINAFDIASPSQFWYDSWVQTICYIPLDNRVLGEKCWVLVKGLTVVSGEEKPSEQRREPTKLRPPLTPSPEIEPEPHQSGKSEKLTESADRGNWDLSSKFFPFCHHLSCNLLYNSRRDFFSFSGTGLSRSANKSCITRHRQIA